MQTTRRALLPWFVAALVPLGCAAAVAAVAGVDGPAAAGPVPAWALLLIGAALTVPAATGLVILRARPGNRVGWIMLAGPVPVTVAWLLEALGVRLADAGGHDGAAALATTLGMSLWPFLYLWPTALAFVFPTGRPMSPRWRAVLAATVAAAAVVIAGMNVAGDVAEIGDLTLPNPLYVEAGGARDALAVVFWTAWSVLLAGLVAALTSVVVRYRRARGVERLQLKWFVWGAALIPLALALCGVSGLVVRERTVLDAMVVVTVLGGGAALSVAVGIAVTRHGLYEIDRLVNRTLVYTLVTALLAAGFGVVAMAVGVLAGRGSGWATAAATLSVAVAFRPLRARVQRLVDRRIARDRYEGLRRMAAFEDALRGGDAEPEDVQAALAEALADPGAELLLRLPESGGFVDVRGRPWEGPREGRTVTPVHLRGEEVGRLVHAERLRERPDTLRSVLAAAALPIELARLRAEVRVQLAQVEASRERLVRAGDEERRRLERDLHDGAQQRLVGLGVALRRIQRTLPREARVLVPALDQAVGEVGRAITDLRTIAAGLRPPRLDDGLAAALGDLARAAPVPVAVDVDVGDDGLAPPVEVAAYYAVCEALTNAAKHARASRVDVWAHRRDGTLLVRVRDDGVGGARPGAGSGLTGIADRVGAHGGRMRIDSGPGAGTLVEVEIPCAS
ncbi:MAG TPA: histidine kinase [Miltoncostaeaceae bacterium]|nr:histidine kinase [Miltoncostaeaceae bacterium]